jgi:hypothetical protein
MIGSDFTIHRIVDVALRFACGVLLIKRREQTQIVGPDPKPDLVFSRDPLITIIDDSVSVAMVGE